MTTMMRLFTYVVNVHRWDLSSQNKLKRKDLASVPMRQCFIILLHIIDLPAHAIRSCRTGQAASLVVDWTKLVLAQSSPSGASAVRPRHPRLPTIHLRQPTERSDKIMIEDVDIFGRWPPTGKEQL